MKLSELGERSFLSRISELLRFPPGSKLGFDEDASDYPLTPSMNLVMNVDTFVASTDRLPGMSEAQIGRKTAVMALSDLAAKGIKTQGTMLSLCVPQDYAVDNAAEIARGFSEYCLKHGVSFIGGDLGSTDDIVLTGTAFGVASPDSIVERKGARVGDIIAVSGKFGLTSLGFKALLEGLNGDSQVLERAVLACYKPEIDLNLVRSLKRSDCISSSMDCSDGLGITLNTMASHSKKRFLIHTLPYADGVLDIAEKLHLNLLELVMQGGEEFAQVITIPSECLEAALEIGKTSRMGLKPIGEVAEGSGVIYREDESEISIPARGYDNFQEWN